MARLVECVPNFSEGRRPQVIDSILSEIKSVEGVMLLDKEMDKDHNRAVVTFVGGLQEVKIAAFKAIARAAQLIDMDQHKGEHPRMGATDVVPFVPISGVTIGECVTLAKELGIEVADKLGIPVYLYESAATRADRINLADVRKGEYEGLKKEIETNPDRKPDFGPSRLPKAGATAIGARMPLIAFNVYLGTRDIRIARKIAQSLRFATGGFRYVKALGFEIKERGMVQVSMNLVNYKNSPIFRVFEVIKREAERYSVPVISSEIVGLTPAEALFDVSDFYLKLENFKKDQVLEEKLMTFAEKQKTGFSAFLDEVAAGTPVPGGGSVAASAGALGASLVSMACGLTIGKKKYLEHEDELKKVLEDSERLRKELQELIIKDSESFMKVLDSRRLSQNTPEEQKRRLTALQEAYKEAVLVPLNTMEKALEVMRLSRIVTEKGNVNTISDAGASAFMAKSAIEGALLNVRINISSIEDQGFTAEIKGKTDLILTEAGKLKEEIKRLLEEKL
ncbi:MAG: glutamate formimidoyltransferase [candidate division Zixibacteria bacterium]|nr:glutamate formimidoyltransferase [candidate division Zixibacteria bacterium]